ncbi:MAG: NUDIX hydrolase [Oleibacter sp.]|nr:NUDIX hydrolase [Thalassolituus sp.]
MSDQDNPWKTKKTIRQYENPWIQVDHHDVINAAGNPGVYGTVHFKNRAVGVLPIAANGDIWLVGQYRFPLQQYHWEIPMGGAPQGENAGECALRELREETGLRAKSLQAIGHVHLSNSITDEEGFLFVATDLDEGEPEMEETEVLTIKRLPFEEALAMVNDGRITDVLSVLAISRVRLLGII